MGQGFMHGGRGGLGRTGWPAGAEKALSIEAVNEIELVK
jgi:hypothetical protein